MPTLKQVIFVSGLLGALLMTAVAQDSSQRSALTITVAASGERVRITAPSSVVQIVAPQFPAPNYCLGLSTLLVSSLAAAFGVAKISHTHSPAVFL